MDDTSRALLLVQLSSAYVFYKPDSAIILVKQAIQNAQRLHFIKGVERGLNVLGNSLRLQGDLPQALETHLHALQISRTIPDPEGEATSLVFIGAVYFQLSEYRQALLYSQRARLIKECPLSINMLALSNIGEIYQKINLLDSALFFQQQANDMLKVLPGGNRKSLILSRFGILHVRLGNYYEALDYYQKALDNAFLTGDLLNRARNLYQIAEVYDSLKQYDSSLYYAMLSFNASSRVSLFTKLNASNLLVKLYQSRNRPDSAFYFLEAAVEIKDSLLGPNKFQQLQLLTLSEQERFHQLQEEQKRLKVRNELTGLLLILGMFLLIVLFLWRTTRQQQKANRLLNDKNNQIEKQRNELEQTLTDLKFAQIQLMHQQKMASLGELTAGIAHEIQNPLNFVNNFSEVNIELYAELRDRFYNLAIVGKDEEEMEEILKNIEQNEAKIIYHGKRADAIVKGMLMHSRTNTGAKETVNINTLVDEYLTLSYHGLRAKDKAFDITINTDYDETIRDIQIIPQEMGRVMLNLYNNAFYALSEKQKQKSESFEPNIFVSTKKVNNKIEIRVKDNGIGIPRTDLQKIFQPFFTTKAPGQGTGLGLSISYDIIKAHGGEIKVETREMEFAEFVIEIPAV